MRSEFSINCITLFVFLSSFTLFYFFVLFLVFSWGGCSCSFGTFVATKLEKNSLKFYEWTLFFLVFLFVSSLSRKCSPTTSSNLYLRTPNRPPHPCLHPPAEAGGISAVAPSRPSCQPTSQRAWSSPGLQPFERELLRRYIDLPFDCVDRDGPKKDDESEAGVLSDKDFRNMSLKVCCACL